MSDPRTVKFPGSGPMPETLQAARGCWVPRPFEALHPDERSDTYMNRLINQVLTRTWPWFHEENHPWCNRKIRDFDACWTVDIREEVRPFLLAILPEEVFWCRTSCKSCCGQSCDIHLGQDWGPSDPSDSSGKISHPSHGSTFRKKLQPGCNLCKSNRVEARHASCQSIFASSAACWGSSILRTPAVSAPPSESPQRG